MSTETRLALGRGIVEWLEKQDDPRAVAALETYRAQVAELERLAAAETVPETGPRDQVVGMKTLSLFGQAGGNNG
jgi:hypothetical protein